ncbi:hypothetical protein EVAR_79260_1 [Eumeta japonica]|uniref:Uncharacterized protein n=1 Tax=Eumeta variegata TaxID=151549 RepID=A0A4C1TEE8_EUMVA|nr:hypothetical protein EVAR_79260_1 [Eumeta japonica]
MQPTADPRICLSTINLYLMLCLSFLYPISNLYPIAVMQWLTLLDSGSLNEFSYKRKCQAQFRRYPIPIEAYATVSIQEEMPGTSEERQPTLSESYTTVFAQEEMAGTSPERQPIPSESYATDAEKIRRKRVGVGALLTEPLNLNGSKHYSAALQAYGQFY